MNDDELDPGSRERLHRLLEESSGHPVPTGFEGRVVPHARRRRRAGRALGAVLVFAVVAGATVAVLLISTRGTATRPQTAGGPTSATPTPSASAIPSASGSSDTAYVGMTILDFNGGSWRAVTPATLSPAVSLAGPELAGVTCPSVDDCWGVGYFAGAEGGLIEHYDGSVWSTVTVPTLSARGGLDGVSCPEADQCWAVGTIYEPNGTTESLIEAYDGSEWTVVVSGIASGNSQAAVALRNVSCVTATDCWAVGGLNIEHYDGSTWSAYVTAGAGESRPSLSGVTCVGASDCWAVGGTAVMHYDGIGWSLASGTSAPDSAPGLNAVTCVTSADCWAVGQDGSGAGPQAALILHWQGSDWTSVVPTPSAGIDPVGVTCVGPNDCWTVGAALLNP